MNEMFSQGGKGSTGILTNKQAIARKFGVKQSEVLYAKPGAVLTGYKVVYDKVSQRSYALPSNLPAGATITSLTDGILVHNTGTVDLGALAVLRGEFVTLVEDFTSGFTVKVKNELVSDGTYLYRWAGSLPKTVSAGSSVSNTGGFSQTAWILGEKSEGGYITLKYFGAKGDGTSNDTAAVLNADAFSVLYKIPIHVQKGEYKVLNATLKGHWIFEDESWFIGTLAERDNIVVADSGLIMESPRFKKTLSNRAVDGDFGNAIRIGAYRQPAGGTNTRRMFM